MPILSKKIFSFDIEREFFIYNFSPKIDDSKKCLKALFNGIACAINFLLTELRKNKNIQKLYIDGGLSKSDYLAQTQSSISNICVIQKQNHNSTLLGVIFLIGIYKNIWTKQDIKDFQKLENKVYFSLLNEDERSKIQMIWDKYFYKTI